MANKQKISILGGGALATAIVDNLNEKFDIDVFDRNRFDISSQEQCDAIASNLSQYDIVIITSGKFDNDLWGMWLVNTVGPAYLISKLDSMYRDKKIIAVTSYGSSWTSWPEIDLNRLVYNSSKSGLTTFLQGLIHRDSSKNKISILEPSKFQSSMSNYTGADIDLVVNQIKTIIDDAMHIIKIVCK